MNSCFQSYYLAVKSFFIVTLTILVMALTLLIGDIRKQLNEYPSNGETPMVQIENPSNVKAYCECANDTVEEFTKNLSNLDGETPNVETENLSGGEETNVESEAKADPTLGDEK